MRTLAATLAVLACLLLPVVRGWAETIEIPVTGGELVSTPEGNVLVLLQLARPDLPEHISLGRAWLHRDGAEVTVPWEVRFDVRPISQPWAPGGGSWDLPVYEEIVDRVSLREGDVLRGVDLSHLIRGVLDAGPMYGLMISVPRGSEDDGFQLPRGQVLRAALQQMSLEVEYRQAPAPREARGT